MSLHLYAPLGFRFDGRPFYGFSGAEGEGEGSEGTGTAEGSTGNGEAPNDPERLKRSLDAARSDAKSARDEFRPVKAVLRELGIDSPEALRDALLKGSSKQDTPQVDVEKIRETERAAVRLESAREIALVEVKAEAKGRFIDPTEVVDHLRKHVDDLLGRDGKPDSKAIARELDDLAESKAHWLVKSGPSADLDFDGGARQTAGGKTTMDGWLRKESARKRGH